jgi:8-amino-7-oxononanoate synthase
VSVSEVADRRLGEIRARGTHREMRLVEGRQQARMRVAGRDVLMFAGSNYLDLAAHPEVVEAAARAARDSGCAAGGSRLINGNLPLHLELEERLAAFVGCEAALVFSTGYMANVGVIPSLVGDGDVLVSDELNHASIVDGARLSRARVRVFAHGDAAALDAVLAEERPHARAMLVAVDGVYSMDGDLAPLAAMRAAAERHGAMLLVDDAHGTGTLGAGGRGSLDHAGLAGDSVDVVLGTLGKSLGSFGAFVAGSSELRELLVNTARSFIFSCALAPPQLAAALAALDVLEREPWRRYALQSRAAQLRARLATAGISTEPSSTHIVPVILGDNALAMRVCEQLLERGCYAQGIRHPSVPEGTARLRVTLMSSHSESDVDLLADELVALVGKSTATRPPTGQQERGRPGAGESATV